jgi:hypothetical protein
MRFLFNFDSRKINFLKIIGLIYLFTAAVRGTFGREKKIFLFWLTKDVVGFSWFPNPSVGSEVLCSVREYIATLLL